VTDSDYPFRFQIERPRGGGGLDDLVRVTLRELLAIVDFRWQGSPVRVDGFVYLSDPETVHAIADEPTSATSAEISQRKETDDA
jgi:hypothetical protein